MNLTPRSSEIMFANEISRDLNMKLFFNCPNLSKFRTEQGSNAAIVSAKFRNVLVTEIDVLD